MPICLLLLQAAPASRTSAVLAAMIPVVATALFVLFSISLYNGLVRARVRTREAWSGIDVQLKRRASLIPNLVQTVRGYATHEHEVFTEVTEARGALAKAAGPAASAAADGMLTQALGRLMVVAENYPALQAAGNFAKLQEELSDTEEKVAYARQFYNVNALNYNTRIQSFPGNMMAAWFKFEPAAFFAAEPSVNEDIQVTFAKA
jgi:LemA protein